MATSLADPYEAGDQGSAVVGPTERGEQRPLLVGTAMQGPRVEGQRLRDPTGEVYEGLGRVAALQGLVATVQSATWIIATVQSHGS